MSINNWDQYKMVDGRSWEKLLETLKREHDSEPMKVVQWGFTSIGKPFVVLAKDTEGARKKREKPVAVIYPAGSTPAVSSVSDAADSGDVNT